MDRELLRHLLLAYLKTDPSTQLNSIYGGVATMAVQQGHFPRPDNFVPGTGFLSVEILPEADRLTLQELTWEMVIQGIITPGANWSNPNLPFVRLTEYGRRCVEEEAVIPQDYGMYLQNIQTVTTTTDSVFLLYLTESVQAFNKGLYISCTVNLGIASERLTVLLIDAFKAALANPTNRTKFQDAINKQRHIAYQFEELFKRLVAHKATFPPEIADDLDMIKFLAELIRKERNDAGHPTGRNFTREEALVLLIAFPQHYKTVTRLLEWLASHPATL